MMRILTLALAAAVFAAPASAQNRSGFWFDMGVGAGSLRAKASAGGNSASDDQMGFSGNLALGGTVSPMVQVGAGTFGWVKEPGTMGNLMGIVNVFPSANGNLWLRGGAGYYVYTEDTDFGNLEFMGFSGAIGVGYDFMVSRTLGIAPYATLLFGTSGEVQIDGFDTGVDGSFTMFQIGGMLSIN